MKALGDDPESVKEDIQDLVQQLTAINAMRLIGAIQNRVGEQIPWPNPLPSEWDDLTDVILQTAQDGLIGSVSGSILRSNVTLTFCSNAKMDTDAGKLRLLLTLSQGARSHLTRKHTSK